MVVNSAAWRGSHSAAGRFRRGLRGERERREAERAEALDFDAELAGAHLRRAATVPISLRIFTCGSSGGLGHFNLLSSPPSATTLRADGLARGADRLPGWEVQKRRVNHVGVGPRRCHAGPLPKATSWLP